MSATAARIAIVGGGLSGLVAAQLLQQQGFGADVVLLEARASLGGRILSVDVASDAADQGPRNDRVDLGPTWFWPAIQPQLSRLIDNLGLQRFAQFEAGDMLVERSAHQVPTRIASYASAPPSMRLVGGMGALIDALAGRLDGVRVQTGQTVLRLQVADGAVRLDAAATDGTSTSWTTEHVLLALPPRLAMQTIEISPPPPEPLARRWRATDTWMAPHAKYVAVYGEPFWRASGLSGGARSHQGPMVEIHDASMPGGSAALFGFIGVPAQVRQGISDAVMRAHCRAQLVRLFGPEAAAPRHDVLKDWAADALTATAADLQAGGDHPHPPPTAADQGPWRGRITGIASEWSPQFPGYLAGAVDAAARGVQAWLEQAAAAHHDQEKPG
jgi:monoamine oxidase